MTNDLLKQALHNAYRQGLTDAAELCLAVATGSKARSPSNAAVAAELAKAIAELALESKQVPDAG